MLTRITGAKAESLFLKCFLKFAKLHGFNNNPDRKIALAYKKTSFGYLSIGNTITDYAFNLHSFCSVAARLDVVENIIAPYAIEIEETELDYYAGSFVTLFIPSVSFTNLYAEHWEIEDGQFIIPRSEEGVQQYCALFEEMMKEHLMPFAESLIDYKILERKLREATNNYEDFDLPKAKSGIRFDHIINLQFNRFRILIIARLAEVIDFDEVYKKLCANNQKLLDYGGRFAKHPAVMKKIYQLLKGI